MKFYKLICFLLAYIFISAQEKDMMSVFKDFKHKGNLKQLHQDLKKMKNKELASDMFTLGKLGGAHFTSEYLGNVIRERLTDPKLGREFAKELFSNIKKVQKNENGVGFSLVSLSLIEKRLRKGEGQNKEFTIEYFQELRNLTNTPAVHLQIKSKAIASLGKFNSEENRKILSKSLKSDDLIEVKSAGKGMLNLMNYASQSQKDEMAEELITSIDRHRSKLNSKNDGSNLLLLRPVLNALGRVKSDKANNYLKKLYNESKSPELSGQLLYALSYKADKKELSFILRQTEKNFNNSKFVSKIKTLLPAVINDNKKVLSELKESQRYNDNIMFMRAIALNREIERSSDIKDFLKHSNARIRQEAIKTLHVLLPFNEKRELFINIRKNETDESVLWQIEQSIGI